MFQVITSFKMGSHHGAPQWVATWGKLRLFNINKTSPNAGGSLGPGSPELLSLISGSGQKCLVASWHFQLKRKLENRGVGSIGALLGEEEVSPSRDELGSSQQSLVNQFLPSSIMFIEPECKGPRGQVQ